MKSSEYWRERFEILQEAQIHQGEVFARSLEQEFKAASTRIQNELEVWLYRLAKNNELSLADAKKLLDADELAEFKWTVEEYIAYGEENALNQKWIKQLENASAKVHINQLDARLIDIRQKTESLYNTYYAKTKKALGDIYTEGYCRSAFELQRGVNTAWEMPGVNQKQLEAILSKPWTTDGVTFSDRIWKQKSELLGSLKTELTQSLMRGDAPDKAISVIAKRFDVAKGQAGRLVMTESAYFSSVSQKDCFNSLGVEQFEILATLDIHTSTICQGLDGKVCNMKDFEAGVTAPPFHPWCRSTTVPYFEDDKDSMRFARGADGKSYYVPSDMKYGEWFEKYIKSDPKSHAIYKGTRNEASDRALFEKYSVIYGKEFPDSLEKFWDLKYNNIDKWKALKEGKQEKLNSLDFNKNMSEKFSNTESRIWYETHDIDIKNHIDKSQTLKEQAMQAHSLRNTYKHQAREMMSDIEKRKELDMHFPLNAFKYYFDKYKETCSTEDEVYKCIIDSSMRPNREVSEKYGLRRELK